MAESVAAVAGRGEPDLPGSHVLSYVTTLKTSTHVREVTARAMRILAVIQLVLAMGPLFLVLSQLPAVIGAIRRWPWRGGIAWDHLIVMLIMGGVPMMLAGLFFTCAGPVCRGRKAGCVLGMAGLVPTIFGVLVAAVLMGGFGLLNGLGLFGARVERVDLVWLLVVPVLAVVVAALFDVWGFLRWIMRFPTEEKARVPFLD